jgi:hypothetical protein
VLGVLLQLFIIFLLILTLAPQFQGFATSAQLALAAGLAGDAYLIASSPIRYNAMSSQVRRDIAWLAATKGCRAIAVIAHSGGVPVAYEALKASSLQAHLDKVRLFISYGSGHGKLHAIEKLLPNRGPFFAISPALLVGGSVGVVGGLLFTNQTSLLIGAAALILYLVLGNSRLNLTTSSRIQDKDLEEIKIGGYVPDPLTMPWKDYYASADPISDGPIRDNKENPRSTRSTEIYNLNSIPRDHSSYWDNNEEFVTEVLRALYEIGDPGGTGSFASEEDDRHITRSAVLRRNRVFIYLASGILSILCVPMLGLGFGKWVKEIGEFVRLPVAGFLPPGVGASIDYWPYMLGMIVIAFVVVLWQQTVLFPSWRFWGREETALLFEDYQRETKHSDSLPFLLLSLVLPLLAAIGILSGLFAGFATDGTLQAEVAGAIDFIPRLFRHDITDNFPILVTIFTWVVVYVAVVAFISSLAIAGLGRWFISRNYRSVHNAEEEIARHAG